MPHRFRRAYANVDVRPVSEVDPDDAVALFGEMTGVYRSLHARKLMLRRELPVTVAYPAAVALAVARGEPVINLPRHFQVEQRGERRRIAFRQSRHTGGALSVKR